MNRIADMLALVNAHEKPRKTAAHRGYARWGNTHAIEVRALLAASKARYDAFCAAFPDAYRRAGSDWAVRWAIDNADDVRASAPLRGKTAAGSRWHQSSPRGPRGQISASRSLAEEFKSTFAQADRRHALDEGLARATANAAKIIAFQDSFRDD